MSNTKNQLWETYISKNPHWETGNITLTPAGLKKLVESSYTQGYKHGVTISNKVHEKLHTDDRWNNNLGEHQDTFNTLFGDIFKGKK